MNWLFPSCVAQRDKNPPAVRETWVRSLNWEDPLEKGKATHFSILAWRFPWTVHPWGHSESDTTERLPLLSYLSHLFLYLLGLGLHRSFTMKLGEITSRHKARFPFKSRLAICGWQKMNHCQKDYSPGENCSVSQSLHSVTPVDVIRVSSSDHRASM